MWDSTSNSKAMCRPHGRIYGSKPKNERVKSHNVAQWVEEA